MLTELLIKGLRGFGSSNFKIQFVVPNGNLGSGLNVLVGQNNSGKSTILEAIKYFSKKNGSISFSEMKRNSKNNFRIELKCTHTDGTQNSISTVADGGSEAIRNFTQLKEIYYIPSRRAFTKNFGKSTSTLENIRRGDGYLYNRTDRNNQYDEFTQFLNKIVEVKELFNSEINKILDFPDWTIDLDESGQYYIKIIKGSHIHNSEGLGEGMISIMTLVGTLILSKSNSIVLIDEPELSLHPDVINKLYRLLLKYSEDRQIIITTHSPYLIDIESIVSGVKIFRIVNEGEEIKSYTLNNQSIDFFKSMIKYYKFPHSIGMDAKNIFFKKDKIIIVEGQEDVVGFTKVLRERRNKELNFYGWGAGGAGNIVKVIEMLIFLGFKKIAAIYDGDKLEDYEAAKSAYPNVHFEILVEDDIRDKDICNIHKHGIMNERFELKQEYIPFFDDMFSRIESFLNS